MIVLTKAQVNTSISEFLTKNTVMIGSCEHLMGSGISDICHSLVV